VTPTCDIVLLSWNNLELLKKCVESILKNTHTPCRLIIVDNNSKTPTKNYLKTLKSSDLISIELDFNSSNEGFSKGMNRGLIKVTAPVACILNNDTQVAPHWLSRVLTVLEKNPDIGAINPNSNIFGTPLHPNLEIVSENLKSNAPFKEMGLCIGFCMFVRKEVIEKIGTFDHESYDKYFFEDSDYCKRVKQAGYKCALALQSYVYHQEHQSVKKMADREAIFKKNQATFYQKWGKPKRILVLLSTRSHEEHTADECMKRLLPIARKDHIIQVFTASNVSNLSSPHTQLDIRMLESWLPFKLAALLKLLIKRKKPYDLIFIPQPEQAEFFQKCQLLYSQPLIKTWRELSQYV
jgi:GT2 family glycosyltransferase